MKRMIRASMTKTEAKEIAKDILRESIGTAYYKVEDRSFSPEEEQIVIDYINKFGKAACRAFGKEYITY